MNASGQLPGPNTTATPGRAVLSVEGIEKSFPGVRALSGADLSVRPGEIHALIGANGAGKSTLIRILAGLESPDAGSILVDGEPVHITNAGRSRELGLMFIHQELALIPRLSIADNLALAHMPARFGVVRRTQCRRQATAAISDSLPGVSVRTPVGELSIAQQWLVALARVHLEAGKVVFLDEPTAALGAREVEHLFGVLRPLASSGVGIVFVSHRLDEVLEITDRVTAMRSGRTISTTPTERHDRASLVRLITGHDHVEPVRERIGDHPGGVVLEARSISSGPVRDVSLTVRAGEVLGVGGLVGSGRSELLETMCGARSLESGQLLLDGEPVRWRSPADAVRRGVALLPEDRHTMALLPRRSVRENTVLAHLGQFALRHLAIPMRRREHLATESLIARLGIRTTGPAQLVDELSGGNQQKVVVGRWLAGDLRVFLVDEPTKGVDVGGKAEILSTLRTLAARGVAVVVTSSELDEVADVADRVVVLREGRAVAFMSEPTTGAAISAACFQGIEQDAA